MLEEWLKNLKKGKELEKIYNELKLILFQISIKIINNLEKQKELESIMDNLTNDMPNLNLLEFEEDDTEMQALNKLKSNLKQIEELHNYLEQNLEILKDFEKNI